MPQLRELRPQVQALHALARVGDILEFVVVELNFFFDRNPKTEPFGIQIPMVLRGLDRGMIAISSNNGNAHPQQKDASCQQKIVEQKTH